MSNADEEWVDITGDVAVLPVVGRDVLIEFASMPGAGMEASLVNNFVNTSVDPLIFSMGLAGVCTIDKISKWRYKK